MGRCGNSFQLNKLHYLSTKFCQAGPGEEKSSGFDLLLNNYYRAFYLGYRLEHLCFTFCLSLLSPPELPGVSCSRTLLPGSTTVKLMPGQCPALSQSISCVYVICPHWHQRFKQANLKIIKLY